MVPLLVLVSCGDDPDSPGVGASPPDSSTTTTASEPATTTTAAPDRSDTHRRSEPPAPEITLIDAGAEPRRELRLELSEGSEHGFTMEVMQAQQLHLDGQPGPEVEMTFAFDIGSTVHSVEDGVNEVEMTYDAVRLVDAGSLGPAQVQQFESTMAGMVGLSFFTTIDDRGTTLATDIPRDFPDMGPEINQMLEEFEAPSIPLPVDAVGVGARWEVRSAPAAYAEMPMPTVAEYELVELHDDRFVVHQRAVATVESSVMESGGTTAEFLGGEIVTEGTMTWSFTSLQPHGEHTSEGSIRFTESRGAESVEGEIFQRARVSTRPLA